MDSSKFEIFPTHSHKILTDYNQEKSFVENMIFNYILCKFYSPGFSNYSPEHPGVCKTFSGSARLSKNVEISYTSEAQYRIPDKQVDWIWRVSIFGNYHTSSNYFRFSDQVTTYSAKLELRLRITMSYICIILFGRRLLAFHDANLHENNELTTKNSELKCEVQFTRWR